MKYSSKVLSQSVIQLCKAKNIEHIVISPGSRNAPLTIGFTALEFFSCYSIVDERNAAFFALGLAQQLQHPVALVCTSGSALLNYYPAIAEAYYSQIPLVILSADRPEHLIDIGDGQTIKQPDVFTHHCLLSVACNADDQSRLENDKLINKALNVAIADKGPVHINLPFNEPLYHLVNSPSNTPKVLNVPEKTQSSISYTKLADQWNKSTKKLILVGVLKPDSIDYELLTNWINDPSVILFSESTSNLYHPEIFPSIDKIIAPLNKEEMQNLQPDILMTMGGMVISKKIKALLREFGPEMHWHVGQGIVNDTFFCGPKHIDVSENEFLSHFNSLCSPVSSSYASTWKTIKNKREVRHNAFLENAPYSDLKVFSVILETLPKTNLMLQISNSTAIRYSQLFTLPSICKVFCNRGTSGIDGSTSTAIGASVIAQEQALFITGDLSFFYDSNAFWNTYTPNSFRIILINNGGGGIFRILPGAKKMDKFETFFETKHQLTAEHLAKMYGIIYQKVDSLKEVEDSLQTFYEKSNAPKLLEITTPYEVNDVVLAKYFEHLK